MPDICARLRVAVLVSGHGRGSNLQALIDGCHSGTIAGSIVVVVGTRADAPALDRARTAGLETVVVSPRKFGDDDAAYGAALIRVFQRRETGLVCLAGYMRKLPASVVAAYSGRVMNIHPGLLPLFGGPGMYGGRVHAAAIESGMKFSGCTVHFVDENYDTGPIILQRVVPILDEDTPETLAGRVLPEEHRAYTRAVALFAADRLRIVGRRVFTLPEPVAADAEASCMGDGHPCDPSTRAQGS